MATPARISINIQNIGQAVGETVQPGTLSVVITNAVVWYVGPDQQQNTGLQLSGHMELTSLLVNLSQLQIAAASPNAPVTINLFVLPSSDTVTQLQANVFGSNFTATFSSNFQTSPTFTGNGTLQNLTLQLASG